MKRFSCLLVILMFLTACLEKMPASTPVASKEQNQVDLTKKAIDKPTRVGTSKLIALSKQCGNSKAMLLCESGKENAQVIDCGKTTLHIKGRNGKTHKIEKPNELADYTAVGLGCVISSAGKSENFLVQYGELPYGCNFCEWFYLYDLDGKQLNSSNPIILSDDNFKVGDKQYANNDQFNDLVNKLSLNEPKIELLQCDSTFDAQGNPACSKEIQHEY